MRAHAWIHKQQQLNRLWALVPKLTGVGRKPKTGQVMGTPGKGPQGSRVRGSQHYQDMMAWEGSGPSKVEPHPMGLGIATPSRFLLPHPSSHPELALRTTEPLLCPQGVSRTAGAKPPSQQTLPG